MSAARYRRFFGRRPAREVDAEHQFHTDMLVEEYLRAGMTLDEARRSAEPGRRDLEAWRDEGVEINAQVARLERYVAWLATIAQDIRFAGRMFAREKLWTALAVLTLAIGIGANSAVFAVVNAALIRPLPFPDPDRIAWITTASDGVNDAGVLAPVYDSWKNARAKSFATLAAYWPTRAVVRGGTQPESVLGGYATHSWFAVFGVPPIVGRTFAGTEDQPGAPRVVVLAEPLWRRLFGADSSVVGRTISLDQQPATVVGIMPAAFDTKDSAQYWEPYAQQPEVEDGFARVAVVGRLAGDASIESARAELADLAELTPPPDSGSQVAPAVMTLRERFVGEARPALLLLAAAVGLLLLIACANVANLLLARAARRQREFAVRIALGASPWRLARFSLCESFLLGLMGATVGLGLAKLAIDALVALLLPPIAGTRDIAIDATVVAFTLVAALVSALVTGLVPAIQARKLDLQAVLSSDTSRASADIRRAWLRRGLVVAELATALMLLTPAALLMKSFAKVLLVDTGVDPTRVIVAHTQLSPGRYDDPAAVSAFFNSLAAGLAAIPGVEASALTTAAPLNGSWMRLVVTPANGIRTRPFDFIAVSPSFFRTAGVQIIAGRAFGPSDGGASEPVAIITQAAAREFGGADKLLGQRMPLGGRRNAGVRVVGIARDVRQDGREAAAPALIYVPLDQFGGANRFTTVLARADGDASRVIAGIHDLWRRIDPNEPLPKVEALRDRLSGAVAPRRFTVTMVAAFASIGAFLAVIGLYGVMSYLVADRTNEIGVRAALGADPGRIVRLVLGEAVTLVASGLGLGLLGSLAGVRLLRTMLFEVDVYDPAIFVAATVVLVITALAACTMPARRAALLDPVEALRR